MSDRPEAKVILDSVSPEGQRMLTFQIKAHRFILAEINTHRKVSKNFRSSRAVPTKKLIEEVRTNPVMPVHWGKNQPGMQAHEELDDTIESEVVETGFMGITHSFTPKKLAQLQWITAAQNAAQISEAMDNCGAHKQISNRLLEPFLWVHGVLSATEFMNMFGLRLHENAQPEFQALAQAMWEAQKESTPLRLQPGEWHLPYVGHVKKMAHGHMIRPWGEKFWQDADHGVTMANLIKLSVHRCAMVSFKPFDSDKPSTVEQAQSFYKEKLHLPEAFTDEGPLVDPIHASPAEHQATPDNNMGNEVDGDIWANKHQWGNLDGWRQYRKMLPGEAVAPLPEAYKIPVG